MSIDVGRLTGLEKTALILLFAGEAHAEKVFSFLNDEESRIIRQSMEKIEAIDNDTKRVLIKEIFSKMSNACSNRANINNITEVASPNSTALAHDRRVWDLINGMNEATLSFHIMTEYPQTICFMLSKIGVQQAARILAQLPESVSLEVVMRLLRRVNIKNDVSRFVDQLFEKNIPVPVSNQIDRDPTEFVADIFSNFEQDIGDKLLHELGNRNMAMAMKVRNKMLKFCDLSRVPASGIQMIISLAPKESLALALKSESSEMKSVFFSCMSERAARMLSEDIESFGSIPPKDIKNAQKSIVCIAAKLIKDNKILVSENNKAQIMP